jgi:SAM-dependent methyltransferase
VSEPLRADADYDRMWDEVYGDLQDFGPTHRHLHRLIRRVLAGLDYESVLDVGVGFGHNLEALTHGRHLTAVAGIDVSERAVEHVASRWPGDFHRLDITTDFLPARFDLVVCALVLEHLADDAAALANLRRMTSKYLLVATIGGDYERYRPWEGQVGHVRNYAPGKLEARLAAAGLTPVRLIRWGFPLYSPVVRVLQNRMRATHELSPASRLLARVLYFLFFLNSSRRGDLIVALARPTSS